MNNIFPRADDAYLIAKMADTTVEIMVTRQDVKSTVYYASVIEIEIIADLLTKEGMDI
jgi:hypothetical protein